MAEEKTARELIFETNRDVKWICRTLERMEARDEDFERRLRTLEGRQAGEERRISTVSAGAGGVVGGVVAVICRLFD